MSLLRRLSALAGATFGTIAAGSAGAQVNVEGLASIGKPVERALGWQPPATELAHDYQWLDGMLLIIITVISLFVVALLALSLIHI